MILFVLMAVICGISINDYAKPAIFGPDKTIFLDGGDVISLSGATTIIGGDCSNFSLVQGEKEVEPYMMEAWGTDCCGEYYFLSRTVLGPGEWEVVTDGRISIRIKADSPSQTMKVIRPKESISLVSISFIIVYLFLFAFSIFFVWMLDTIILKTRNEPPEVIDWEANEEINKKD